jgi:peptide-methionine (R)-S-oxide reductase
MLQTLELLQCTNAPPSRGTIEQAMNNPAIKQARPSFTRRRALALAAALLPVSCSRKPQNQPAASSADGEVTIAQFDDAGNSLGTVRVEKMVLSDAEWMKRLGPKHYYVTRRRHTDPPFTGTYDKLRQPGLYRCVCCGDALFSSSDKYDSGTGWPSFWEPVAAANVTIQKESRLTLHSGLEVTCTRCDAHLGHVFDDGPAPSHLRYCINESALRFVSAPGDRRS